MSHNEGKKESRQMGKIQIWQQDGCGTSENTIRRVIGEFRENGVQGLNGQQCLTEYIRKMDVNALAYMYDLDADVTLQILVDCIGVKEAFEAAMRFTNWISPCNYAEVCKKYDERVAKAQAEADEAQERMFEALRCKQAAEQEAEALKFEIVTLKAKLYDTYEAIHNPTDKNEVKGDHNKCKARTEKTPSGSWA